MSIEAMLFYWSAWFFWIITTFFVKKSEGYRLGISVCVLVTIILTPYQVDIFGYHINLSLVFLYFFIIFRVVKLKKASILYTLITSYIVMMAYASFLLFELYDPVWVLFDRTWLLGFILSYLCVLLHHNKWNRAYILVCGTIQGEIIYSQILQRIGFVYPIGLQTFLNAFAASFIILFFWSLAETIMVNMDQYVNSHIRGKQKST